MIACVHLPRFELTVACGEGQVARQTLEAAWSQLSLAPAAERVRQGRHFLGEVAKERVGDRPDRWEPRAVKRRPKEYDRLNQPRAVLRKLLKRKKVKA